jgi:hypothetical protein
VDIQGRNSVHQLRLVNSGLTSTLFSTGSSTIKSRLLHCRYFGYQPTILTSERFLSMFVEAGVQFNA